MSNVQAVPLLIVTIDNPFNQEIDTDSSGYSLTTYQKPYVPEYQKVKQTEYIGEMTDVLTFDATQEQRVKEADVDVEQDISLTDEQKILLNANTNVSNRRLKRLGTKPLFEMAESAVSEPDFLGEAEEEILEDYEQEVMDEEAALSEENIEDVVQEEIVPEEVEVEDIAEIEDERVEEQAVKQTVQQVQNEEVKKSRQVPNVKPTSAPSDTIEYI